MNVLGRVSVFFYSVLFSILWSAFVQAGLHTTRPPCTPSALITTDIFNCGLPQDYLSLLDFGPPLAYQQFRGFFPQGSSQFAGGQRHNPVYPVPQTGPPFLLNGTFWAAPLTEVDFLRVQSAIRSYGHIENWGPVAAQYIGNVMGVSVAQGLVYVQLGRHEIYALDALTGIPVWKADVNTAAGMGQTVAQEVNGRLMVFAPVGDAAFTVQNVIDFSNNKPHDRGANFSGLYAFDGLTGEQLWRFATKGAMRPTPILDGSMLYLATGGGEFYVLDAMTGTPIGNFTNPGEGFPGLAAPNTYTTTNGKIFVIYGTLRPRKIIAVDVTDPTTPGLGWEYVPPNATANAPGDTPVAVDPDLGLVFTTVFSSVNSAFTVEVLALDAATGTLKWSDLSGGIDSPPGYKGSVPMVDNGVLYVGNTSNGTYQAYNALTGNLLWRTDLREPNDPPDLIHRPRAAGVIYNGKLIFAEGRDIHTFDPLTGIELNRFESSGAFAVWGINQPTIVGNLMILGSTSGWVFAAPMDYITTSPGLEGNIVYPIPPPITGLESQVPDYSNPSVLPTAGQAALFPSTWLSYAGGQDHNSVINTGPNGVSWQIPLNNALPLSEPPLDENLLGTEIATQKMQIAYGAGTGVSLANGIAYAGSGRYSVSALNAITGDLIWRFRTQSASLGEPLVTPNTVVINGGDHWLSLGNTGKFKKKAATTKVGGNFSYLQGLDPVSGIEKWTVFTGAGTSASTPLYDNGNLYWATGDGRVWAINADTGLPIAPFMDTAGMPTLSLGGFNVASSANQFQQQSGSNLMIVGTAMPNQISAIDLTSAQVLWSQPFVNFTTYVTGFAAVSPAVDQAREIVVGTVLIDADPVLNTATVLAYGLNANTGAILWTQPLWAQPLGSGPIPTGFTGPTPLLDADRTFLFNPIAKTITALNTATGLVLWQTPVLLPTGKYSWGPGVLVQGKLIQPVGPNLYTLDAATGQVLNQYPVGGSLTYQHPTVVGDTLYIGNAWGWVSAYPLSEVTGEPPPPFPTVTGIWPGASSGNTIVFVFGSNFVQGQTQVALNGVTMNIMQVLDDTVLMFLLPASNIVGPITVTTPIGSAASSVEFGNIPPGLSITGMWPANGSVGDLIFLFGSGYEPMGTAVSLGGVTTPIVQVIDQNLLIFGVPPGASTSPITVTTSTETSTSLVPFQIP